MTILSLAANAADQPPHGNFAYFPTSQSRSAILALDLGSNLGWALSTSDGSIVSGTNLFRPNRYEGGGMRYLRFRSWLNEIADRSGPINAIYFEEVRRHVGTDAAHIYGGFLAHLSSWCEAKKIAYQGAPVGTIKRFIAGKGNADKQAVIDAVRVRGFSPADDNEADAIAILLWAIETHGGVR
jgi:Holliday junction resolvasome RuvABC endonuclease subunit